MSQAYLNGRWLPTAELAIPFSDAGFVLGATVTEQLRTFGGQVFRLEEHLDRLFRSLEIIALDPGVSRAEFAALSREIVARNFPLMDPQADVGLGMFVTPGAFPTLSGGVRGTPTVCLYTYPLPFHLWAEKYERGESIVISDIEQISPQTWPAELKCRSRMHYYLADQHAAAAHPGSRAILLDREGMVSEATSANLLMFRASEGLVSPPVEKILPGISLLTLGELAAELGIPLTHRDIRPEGLAQADELLLTSTSICVLPVVRCQGQPIKTGQPGEIYRKLLAAWSHRVKVDIASQARHCAAQPR